MDKTSGVSGAKHRVLHNTIQIIGVLKGTVGSDTKNTKIVSLINIELWAVMPILYFVCMVLYSSV